MSSEKQIAANRRNARRSTGPRSRAGKSRARRNGLHHALAVTVSLYSELSAEVERLTAALADGSDPLIRGYAAQAAEAELTLLRVRQMRIAAIESSVRSQPPDCSARAFAAALPELAKLERYERRAFSRRRRALRLLTAADVYVRSSAIAASR